MVIAGGNANTNYGTSGSLLVKNVSPPDSFTRKVYLRFDLSTITTSITEASLGITVGANNNGNASIPSSFNVTVFGLKDNNSAENWGETTITWNNAPGNINSGSSFDSTTTVVLGTLAITTSDVAGTRVNFSSSALLEFLQADTDDSVTIMLARTDTRVGENLSFNAKEAGDGSTAASLSLATTPAVPEPGTAAITLLAAGSALLKRRRPAA